MAAAFTAADFIRIGERDILDFIESEIVQREAAFIAAEGEHRDLLCAFVDFDVHGAPAGGIGVDQARFDQKLMLYQFIRKGRDRRGAQLHFACKLRTGSAHAIAHQIEGALQIALLDLLLVYLLLIVIGIQR